MTRSERIDLAAQARLWTDNAVRAQASNEPETLTVAYAGIAQAYATLAVAEQIQLANLIAITTNEQLHGETVSYTPDMYALADPETDGAK